MTRSMTVSQPPLWCRGRRGGGDGEVRRGVCTGERSPCSLPFADIFAKDQNLLWYQMLEITVTLAAGELKNALEDEHKWFLVLVNWQRFLYIAKSI
jgi:hypothetical protein